MYDQDKKEIEALVAAVSTLHFVLENVTLSKRKPVDLSVSIQNSTTSKAMVTITCTGDKDACDGLGNIIQDFGNWACSSTEDGISCTLVSPPK